MERLFQRCRSACDNLHVQDIAEYAVMLAVILLLVIGTVKLIGGWNGASSAPAADQLDRSNHQQQNHGQHHCIFCYVLDMQIVARTPASLKESFHSSYPGTQEF